MVGINEDTIYLIADRDNYNKLDILPKVNKANMAGKMESIKEYLRSNDGNVRAPLATTVRKII